MNTKEKVKNQIDEMDDQINIWEAKIESVKAKTKVWYTEKLADLKSKRNEVKAKYDELDEAKDEKWEEKKDIFSAASESFRKGTNKLKSLFD